MKISIKSKKEKDFNIRVPSFLILNSLTLTCAAGLINRKLKKSGISKYKVPAKQLRRLAHVIKRYKRKHRKWNLVEVITSDDEQILIKL